MAVGSAPWIAAEKENVLQLLNQEKEEIIYPAQHEMEWLNEHMAEIFSKNQFNVTDVFKTPGKLRGKTPRTNRKKDILENRVPLSDVFSANTQSKSTQSPSRPTKFDQKIAHFAIAKDTELQREAVAEPSAKEPPNHYIDSGYHGMTEDEMELDHPITENSEDAPTKEILETEKQITSPNVQNNQSKDIDMASEERRTTEGSFHSAREEVTRKVSQPEPEVQNEEQKEAKSPVQKQKSPKLSPLKKDSPQKPENVQAGDLSSQPAFDEQDLSDFGSPSDGSTPDRPIVRKKSSLTFASLPAREPIPTKKSFGNRVSRTSQIDQARARSSHFAGLVGGSRVTQAQLEAPNRAEKIVNDDVDMVDKTVQPRQDHAEESDPDERMRRMHNKSSTQRLHERIGMLGKSQPSRASKSITQSSNIAPGHVRYPQLNTEKASAPSVTSQHPNPSTAAAATDDDDDWIKPPNAAEKVSRPQMTKSHTADIMEGVTSTPREELGNNTVQDSPNFKSPPALASPEQASTGQSPSMPRFAHNKSASTISLVSPAKATMPPGHKQNISVSNPPYDTTTPAGSPKKLLDGPLSASKSKFQSIMKTAKGLFTSGASISATAKMETLSPQARQMAEDSIPGLFSAMNGVQNEKPLPASPQKEPRKTRSSTEREREERRKEKEREKEAKERQRMQDKLEKAREKEQQKAAEYKQNHLKSSASVASLAKHAQPVRRSPRRAAGEDNISEKTAITAQSQTSSVSVNSSTGVKPNEARRPFKPTMQANSKPKEPPRSIRIGMPSQRMGPPSSTFTGLQDTLQPAATRPKTLVKQASNTSLHTSASSSSLKTSASSQAGKLKSLAAAAKKKEQDEREAKRKEELRQEQRSRAEFEKKERERAEAERKERERVAAEEARKKQALEKRKQLEQAKKLEQQRSQHQANVFSSSVQDKPSTQRDDAGPSRPPSRLNNGQPLNRSMVHHPLPNPAKPAKRPLEDDAGSSRQLLSKLGASTAQQPDSKRRRTEDEIQEQPSIRPIMAPPTRQSNIRKDQPHKPTVFAHGYSHAPPVAPHHHPSSHAFNNSTHHNQHPSNNAPNSHRPIPDMAKFANGKVPFADIPNPPSVPTIQNHHSKTPGSASAAAAHLAQQRANLPKSSPHYPSGENIHLPDIPTDSEDEDSDDDTNKFPVPSWAEPDALESALITQDAMNIDPDSVFGPMAPLRMEEIFAKGNKDRLKRFRDRTSSANWVLSGDGLTMEEVRADREGRERIRGEGGWRFGAM
ncbi:MAG: hypothetical protein Q9227_009398 [Pyrenula ochraceoflavens]